MVSIIVPCYDAERWLGCAVASVVGQSCGDWELVLVDDGSHDGTGALCDRFAASDPRIRVRHTKNGGLSAARNAGLEIARGEWIAFLDADDLLHPLFLERMLEAADRTGAGIVNCGMQKFEGDTCDFPEDKETPRERVYDPTEAIRLGLYQRQGVHTSAWGKIYRRNLWATERFTPGLWYEDLDAFCRVWPHCGKFAQTDAPMYGYRQHPASFLHRFSMRRLDVLHVTEKIERWAADKCHALLPAARDRRLSAAFNIFYLSEHSAQRGEISRDEAARIQARCYELIRQRRSGSLSGRHTRMKNRLGALVSYLGPGMMRKLSPLF